MVYQTLELPCGYRFSPTDEELVAHYLKKKINNEELKYAPIHEVPLNEMDPEELIEKYETDGDQAWYFFSTRNRRYPNGRRPTRSTKQGYWRATGSDKCIVDPHGIGIIGLRKSLVFYMGKQGNEKGNKTPLMMHEYRIPEAEVPLDTEKPAMKFDDWVLCKIYYNRSDDRSATKKNLKPRQKMGNNCLSVRHQPLKKCPSPIYGTQPLSKLDNYSFASPLQFNMFADNQLVASQLPTQETLNKPIQEVNPFVYLDPMEFSDTYFNTLENSNYIDPMKFSDTDFNPLENSNQIDVASSYSNLDFGDSNNHDFGDSNTKIPSYFNDPSCQIYFPPGDDCVS